MHRTTTTATLLVTVAVTALSGCVTVQRPPAPGPPAAPSGPVAPRPDRRAEPQIVQAPAREALELVGPPRRPEHPAAEPRRPHPHTPAPAAQPPKPRTAPPPEQPPARRPQSRPAHPPRTNAPDIPAPVPKDITKDVPKGPQDVCALGRKYGGWHADSPEATICRGTYGH
ncbi:hypothetical protein ACWDV7_22515 [Streptomyces sp. NPDC003362]